MEAAVVADNYKVPQFEKELTAAGFTFEKISFTDKSTLLKVKFEKKEQIPVIHEICTRIEKSVRQRN